eukprot:7014772-Prymnesium_polylepis.1
MLTGAVAAWRGLGARRSAGAQVDAGAQAGATRQPCRAACRRRSPARTGPLFTTAPFCGRGGSSLRFCAWTGRLALCGAGAPDLSCEPPDLIRL